MELEDAVSLVIAMVAAILIEVTILCVVVLVAAIFAARARRKEAEARKTVPYWENKREAAQKTLDEANSEITRIESAQW